MVKGVFWIVVWYEYADLFTYDGKWVYKKACLSKNNFFVRLNELNGKMQSGNKSILTNIDKTQGLSNKMNLWIDKIVNSLSNMIPLLWSFSDGKKVASDLIKEHLKIL